MWGRSSTWPHFRFKLMTQWIISLRVTNTFHSGQHALHYRWCSLCCCQSPNWISPWQVKKDLFEMSLLRNTLHRVLEPSLCLLGGTATIGLGFVILASPPLILDPSLAQVLSRTHSPWCLLWFSFIQICVGAGLHGLGMSACFIASLTLMTEAGGKSVSVDQVNTFEITNIAQISPKWT